MLVIKFGSIMFLYKRIQMFLWMIVLTLRSMSTSCTCGDCTVNVTIDCLLHPSLVTNTSLDLTSRQYGCHANVLIVGSVLDTDNHFLLQQKVKTYNENNQDVYLLLIGQSWKACHLQDQEEDIQGHHITMNLPCHKEKHKTQRYSDEMFGFWSVFTPKTSSKILAFLSQYVKSLPQTTLVIFYEEAIGDFHGVLLDTLLKENRTLKLMMYSDHEFKIEKRKRQFLLDIHHRLYVKGIYGIILGSETVVSMFLRELNDFDCLNPRTSDFRHRSYWLVVNHIMSPDILLDVSLDLENLAIISPGYATHEHREGVTLTQWLAETALSAFINNGSECRNYTSAEIRCRLRKQFEKTFQSSEWDRMYLYVATETGFARHFPKLPLPERAINLLSLLFPNVKYGYNRRHLNITIQPWPGFMERVEREGRVEYQGMCIEMLHVMQDALNFTYTLHENAEQTWGAEVNGTWIGMVGELHRKEADMALADVTLHYQRDQVADYVLPAFKTEVTDIVYRKWDTEEFIWTNITRPFRPLVVLCIAASLIFVMFLVSVTERMNPYYGPRGTRRPLDLSLRTLWYLIGSVLMQGGGQEPESWTGRVLMSTWWLFCIVMAATYSATLIVSFAVRDDTPPFTSLAELVETQEYRWGMFDGSISMLILTNSTRPDFQKAIEGVREFAKTDPSVLSTGIEVQLKKVQTEKYALISSRVTLEYMISVSSTLGIDLQILGDVLYSDYVALAVPSQSPFMPDLQRVMATMSEIGLLRTWEKIWWNTSSAQNPSLTLGGKPITMSNFMNALYLVAMGTGAGLLALLVEYVFSKLSKRVKCIIEKSSRKSTTLPVQAIEVT